MQYLKADTVTEVLIGPVVAVGDGFTPVTTLTIAGADEAEIIKHGATTVTAITGTLAAITSADGYYALDLVTGDVDTEGRLTILINDDSLCLPVRHDFMVVNANVFDSLFAAATTDYLQTDTVQWLGTACATPTVAGVPEVDLTHVAGATTNVSALATNVDAILTDTADMQPKLGTPAGASISADILVIDNFVDGLETTIGAAGVGLTNIGGLGIQPLTDIKSRMETVMNAYEPAKISVSGRLVDVSANGNVGIDWNNIDAPTTSQNLSGTTISAVSGAVGSVTGDVGGNVTGSLGALVANAIDNNSIHSNACAKIADSGIQRGASNWENNSDDRSLGWAISKLVNKVDLNAAGDTLSIRKSNDSTALFTQAVTTSGGAAPVVSLDTA